MRDEAAADGGGGRVVVVDSRGLVHLGRPDLEMDKREVAWPTDEISALARDATGEPTLQDVVTGFRPTVLLGATGTPGTFDEPLIRALAAGAERPIVMPLSNPTAASEARPADILRWSDGRAIVASGSPFPAVSVGGSRVEIGQANNVFVFPGLGLGAIAAEATSMPDDLFLAAARTLAGCVTDERLRTGAIYPPVAELRLVTRRIAMAVARCAVELGISPLGTASAADAAVDQAMWWPDYVPYVPAEDRRSREP
jgi:malic enzyme